MSLPVTSATEPSRPATASCPSEEQERSAEPRWEEPHPGQRLPNLAESASPSWGERSVNIESPCLPSGGEYRGGMTAKAYTDHRSHRYRIQRSSFVKRDVRVRRHLKAQSRPVQEYERRNLIGLGLGDSTIKAKETPIVETQPRISVDTEFDEDTGTDISMETEAATLCTDDTLVPVSTPSLPLALADLSHFLEDYPADADTRPATLLGPDAFSDARSEDMYGWDAELDRKLMTDDGRKRPLAAHPFSNTMKRGNIGARKLFQRVFSLGNPRATTDFDADLRASVAN